MTHVTELACLLFGSIGTILVVLGFLFVKLVERNSAQTLQRELSRARAGALTNGRTKTDVFSMQFSIKDRNV